MADNPKIRDGRDRAKVSKQQHELAVLMKKFAVSRQQVVGAKQAVGNNRKKVEAYLKKNT